MMLVEVPSIPGNTKQATYWKCLAPGCNQQCIGKNATKALAHGSRDRLLSSTKLKWIRREGWHAMAEPPDYVGDGDDDDKLEPLAITDEVLIELIKNTTQSEDLNVRMVKEGDNEVEGEEDEERED